MVKQTFSFSKKGDISTTILVIGVFAICVLAIGNFYYSNSSLKNSFYGVAATEKLNSYITELNFYLNPKINQKPEGLMDIFSGVSDGNFYFKAEKKNGVYNLSASYSEHDTSILGFGFGKMKRIVYIEYLK